MNPRLKKLANERAPFAVSILQSCIARVTRMSSRRKAARLLKERRELLIEVGAGDRRGQNGWITIDMAKNCDLRWDLRYGLPFPAGSVNKIYSSHFFEHLTYKETQGFLAECRRVMAPGGTFSVCVPNAKIYLDAYVKGDTLPMGQFFGYGPGYNNTTKIDYVNYMAYMDGEHKYMFDEENLLCILAKAGFKNVTLRQFDPNLDMEARDFESIYAQAEK